jgi:hypothetical protein
MRSRQEVDIEILPGGIVKIDLVGFEGLACEKMIESICVALGTRVSSSTKKSEYYTQVTANQISIGKSGTGSPGMGSGMK